MKTKQIGKTLLLCMCLVCGILPLAGTVIAADTGADVWDGSVATGFDGGDGSETDPYEIATGAQLAYLRQQVNGGNSYDGSFFVLTNSLSLSNKPWIPIGYTILGRDAKPFKGSFDGQDHTIFDLTVSDSGPDPECLGLFGSYEGESIRNLSLRQVTIDSDKVISADACAGALVGKISTMANIGNCHVYNVMIQAGGKNGGLVGTQSRGLDNPPLEGRYIDCTVQNVGITQTKSSGQTRSGGLVGYVSASLPGDSYLFEDCRAEGSITVENSGGTYATAGGLFGMIDNGWYNSETDNKKRADFTIRECYAAVSIQADGLANTGGLIAEGSMLKLENCHAAGDVVGGGSAGGLVGYGSGLELTGCSAAGNVSGSWSVGGLVGAGLNNMYTGCFATGNVTATDWHAGGLVGWGPYSTLTRCYATGDVKMTTEYSSGRTGGLMGNGYDSVVTDCYASGDVEGWSQVSGLVGWTAGTNDTYDTSVGKGAFTNCFAFGMVTAHHTTTLYTDVFPLVHGSDADGVTLGNCYYSEEQSGIAAENPSDGTNKTSEQFADGTVAELLGDAFVGRTDFPHPVLASMYQSDLATLKSLSYRVNGGDPVPVPDFATGGDFYTVSLPRSTPRDAVITLAGICADRNAVITENTGVTLVHGAAMEPAGITVTAQDGTTKKTYTLYVYTSPINPDMEDASIGGIEAGQTFVQNETPDFTATGSGMDDSTPAIGDQRYRPVSWKVDNGGALAGNFAEAPFTGSLDLSRLTVGTHTLTVEHVWERFGELLENDAPTGKYGWTVLSSDMPEELVKTVSFTVDPVTYTLTVVNSTDKTGGNPYEEGEKVSLKADAPAPGYVFDKWELTNGSGTFADATKAETVFTMGAGDAAVTATYKDVEAPSGEIAISGNKWKEFLNTITFGLFFKEKQDVTITAEDTSGEAVTIEYFPSADVLSLEDVKAKTEGWTVYDGKFGIDPDVEFIVYVRLTDAAGNVSYLSSDGVILDATPPIIAGAENKKTYDTALNITATDKYLESVTVNGSAKTVENGESAFALAENGTYSIIAKDQAGNETVLSVTIELPPTSYTLTFDTDGGKPVPAPQTLEAGDKPSAVADPTKEGYTFLGWYDGETKVDMDSFKMPANNVTLTAKWEKQQDLPSDIPATGDDYPAWALWLLAMSLGGIAFTWKSLRRQQR